MTLTSGQIESFSLIAMNVYACAYAKYVKKLQSGFVSDSAKEDFFGIQLMIKTIFGYDTNAENNCLNLEQVTNIVVYLNDKLCMGINLKNLPETNLNT